MKIIAEVDSYKDGRPLLMLYCVGEGGGVVRSVTDTLLRFIVESSPSDMLELDALFQETEKGLYVPENLSLPDWGLAIKTSASVLLALIEGAFLFPTKMWKLFLRSTENHSFFQRISFALRLSSGWDFKSFVN